MVGAEVTMMASALMRSGIEHLGVVKRDLPAWLDEHDTNKYASCGAA